MSTHGQCKPGDALHHADGSHRTTARTTRGRDLARYENAITRHLASLPKKEEEK